MDHGTGANNSRSTEKDEVLDLRMDCRKQCTTSNSASPSTSSRCASRGSSLNLKELKSKRRNVNMFKKHKLKYRYLRNRHSKQNSDSGNFGSSTTGSSSNGSNEKTSSNNESTSSPSCTSSSPSSGSSTSNSPQAFASHVEMNSSANQQQTCMMLGHAVPLIVMMQGQMHSATDISYSNTMFFKCNLCNMFSNNLPDVLNHVNNSHSEFYYCFVCHQFQGSKGESERHKEICATAHQAFHQIIGGNYQNNRPSDGTRNSTRDQALNLSVAEDVAKRAAHIVHSKKSRRKKIKKLLKCTYCKKAFFGRFYLQRHLRSHTGEKACHCDICGKGFVEWRNLRNHVKRFHNGSESTSSRERNLKSVSPNGTSESEEINPRYQSRRLSQSGEQSGFSQYNSIHTTTTSISQSVAQNTSNDMILSDAPATHFSTDMFGNDVNFRPPSSVSQQMQSEDRRTPMVETQCSNSNYGSSSSNSTIYAASSSNSSTYSSSSSASLPQTFGQSYSKSNTDENSQISVIGEGRKRQKSAGDDPKAGAMYLGSTSSRLELSVGQHGHEQSLNPLSNENGERVFKCYLCNKTFKSKFAMQRHLDFHADIRPYECSQCNYKAKTGPQLKVHVMRHNGKKEFYCSVCNYASVTHSDLNRHCKSKTHNLKLNAVEQNEENQEGATCSIDHNDDSSPSSIV